MKLRQLNDEIVMKMDGLEIVLNRQRAIVARLAATMVDLPAWREETLAKIVARQAKLRPLPKPNGITYPGRNLALLDRVIRGQLTGGLELKVLEVGIGLPPIEPWELLAVIKQNGLSPHITVLESDLKNILAFHQENKLAPYCWAFSLGMLPTVMASLKTIAAALSLDFNSGSELILPAAARQSFTLRRANVELWEPGKAERGSFDLAIALNSLLYVQWAYRNWLPALIYSLSNLLESVRPNGLVLTNHRTFYDVPALQERLGYKILGIENGADATQIAILLKL